jgi:hypothetical protein
MRYLLLIYQPADAQQPTDTGLRTMNQEYAAFTKGIIDRGIHRAGDALQPVSTATTVRVRDGRTVTTDGPFAETKEVLGGYYLVECADLDEAIAVAAGIPGARGGSIEVRPIQEMAMPESVGAGVAGNTARG